MREGNGSENNTAAPACEKCGGDDIYIAYHAKGCSDPDCRSCAKCSYSDHAKAHGEHLHYHCRRCHFDWLGPVKGRKKVADVVR